MALRTIREMGDSVLEKKAKIIKEVTPRIRALAEDMLEKFAMTTYGETAGDILKAADQLSMETVTRYQKNMENIVDMLLKRKELSGEEFVKALGL